MVKQFIEAKVRPLANASLEKASLVGAARLYVNKDALIALTGRLESAPCVVEKVDMAEGEQPLKQEAVLSVMQDKNVSPNVVMMSRALQEATGFKIGDQVKVALAGPETPEAEEVVVRDVTEGADEESLPPKIQSCWEGAVAIQLGRAVQVFPGMTLEGVNLSKLRHTFKVVSVNSKTQNLAKFNLSSSNVRILQAGEEDNAANGVSLAESGGDLILTNVPGFPSQVETINDILGVFEEPLLSSRIVNGGSCGFVIDGGHGTGKTFILQRLAETNWGKVHWIRPSDKLTTLREVFKQAQTQQPCMILIDDLHDLIAQDRSNRDAIIETICTEMDALNEKASATGIFPRVLVVATCLDYINDVPIKLQGLAGLDETVTLPIPRGPERLEILRYHNPPMREEEKEVCLQDIAQRTHAYNCKDLSKLIKRAMKVRRTKNLREKRQTGEAPEEALVTRADMEEAFKTTGASAMQDINLQPPTVHWKDIGGQDSVKKALTRMIKYTKEADPATPRVITPSKGLLLYGPPGCSKTLSAQAMATEASFNFFAVKGAELLNMYVGESERAVRDLFRRARNAAPSIIFFDEIESIGGQRGAGGTANKGSGAVNMITTLLTEMDGFESLRGVLVIAATNHPEAMDNALMRPGRFDELVYVGPPDTAAREAIFNVHLRNKPLNADVDIASLAARSEGHSGAEIKNVCTKAAYTVQTRYDEDDKGTEVLEFRMEDLEAALESEPKRITSDMIFGYDAWRRKFAKK